MEQKKENFRRIAESRTNKIIDMINLLENLSNKSYYEYTDDQIDKIFNSIQDALETVRSKFDTDKKKSKRFRL